MGSAAGDFSAGARDRETKGLALLGGLWAAAALPLVGLRLLGLDLVLEPRLYVPLHAVAEIGLALTGFATAAVQWYASGARGVVRDARARLLGGAFLAAAVLHTAHLLVFPGMPGFAGPSGVERGIFYWLAARTAVLLPLAAVAFLSPAREGPLLGRRAVYLAAAALALGAVAVELLLPDATGALFHPGSGLTGLKIALELSLALVALFGARAHWRRFQAEGDPAALRLSAALGLAALSELGFALYASAHDVFNLLGHAYALGSAGLIFHALFASALLEPYARLARAREDLAASHERLDALRAHVEGELAQTIRRLEEATEREALARAELEAAFEAVPEGIVAYDPSGRIERMNAAAERLLRYEPGQLEESLHARWSRLRPQTVEGKPLALEENPIVRALRGERVAGVVLSVESEPGKRLWVSMSAAAMRADDGRIRGAIASLTDIGTIQRLQSQREDLLRAVSHDLRNPLQITLLQAERLQRLLAGTALEKERVAAERIAQASKNMGVMIRDLVEAARMENGRLALQLAPVRLGALLERLLAHSAGALDVARVSLDVPADLPAVLADVARLERVLVNLVGNALKYSPEGTPVRVTAGAADGKLVVSVADRGVGIAAEDLPRVFERFYRGQRTAKADGLGLGLYIVQLLVDAHGGRVWAESTPGEGSTFSFTLPLA
jgi:PAS domain S-box-containing protein